MISTNIGLSMLKIAAVYMVLGLVLGMVMGTSHDFTLMSVHSHLLLLGWATLAITGLVYMNLPNCEHSGLARVHFWGHNAGLPVMTAGLVLVAYGRVWAEGALVAPGSILVMLSLIVFAVNLLRNGARDSRSLQGLRESSVDDSRTM